MSENFYNLLGIAKNASDTEIKKAYRKLAIKYHPDKSPADKKEEYTEKFKEITEAYEILGDSKKRQIYDQFGKEAALGNDTNGPGRGGVNPFDIFNQFFGGQGGQGGGFPEMPEGFQQFHSMGGGGMPRGFSARFGGNNFTQRKATNIQYILNITLEEGYNGIKKEIVYNIINNNKQEEKKEMIEIPMGCCQKIKMMKQGFGNKKDGLEDGDLEIIVNIMEHELFKVNQNNLIYEKKIKFGTSILGCTFSLTMLDGDNININIVGQIFNDEIRVIKNKGCVDLRSGQKGDLIIKFEVEKCGYLSSSEIEILKTIFEFDNFVVSSDKVEEYTAMTLNELENNDDDDDFPPSMSGENVQCAQS
jgi:DnaJ-class molecular chaperone